METEIRTITTAGDRDRIHALVKIGGRGIFVREIERELLSGEADIAVHSAKDLPYQLRPLVIAGTLHRRIPGMPGAAEGTETGSGLRGGDRESPADPGNQPGAAGTGFPGYPGQCDHPAPQTGTGRI